MIIKQYPVIPDCIKLDIADYTKNSDSLINSCKSINYLENILLKRKTMKKGFDEALILNENKQITECIAHNIFWHSNGIVYTPSINSGILPRITRSKLIGTIKSRVITILEGLCTIDDLLSSTSIFLTNSISGIIKVYSITDIYVCFDDYIFEELRKSLLTNLRWI